MSYYLMLLTEHAPMYSLIRLGFLSQALLLPTLLFLVNLFCRRSFLNISLPSMIVVFLQFNLCIDL
jgi:hypothetical protein